MKCLILFFQFFVLFFSKEVMTNTSYENGDPFSNPVLLSHYSLQELQQMKLQDSVKFNSIVYYYTQSFIVEKIKCEECPFFDKELFDISKYEHLRKKNLRYQKVFWKQGFKLILLSVDELKYKLPIHLPSPADSISDEDE